MVVHREGQSQCIDGAASEETCHIREKEGTEVTLEENAFFSWYPDPPISEHRNDSTYATNNATSQHTTCSPRTESCLVKNPLAKAILSGKRDTRKSHAHKVLRTIVILELVSLERLHSNTSPVHLLLSCLVPSPRTLRQRSKNRHQKPFRARKEESGERRANAHRTPGDVHDKSVLLIQAISSPSIGSQYRCYPPRW